MKLLRTIRLDPSDTFVFDHAAAPGEIAVPGSFAFWRDDIAALAGKRKMAFRSGFLSVPSGGFSTLVQVCECSGDEKELAISQLAALLMQEFGAPSLDAALPAAREEIAASEALAQHAPETLIAMHRSLNEDGEITEQYRTLHRRADVETGLDPRHYRAFTFFESDEEPAIERVDFSSMMGKRNG